MHAYIHSHTYPRTHIHRYTLTHTNTHTGQRRQYHSSTDYTQKCPRRLKHTRTYTHTHAHTHTNTHTHSYITPPARIHTHAGFRALTLALAL